MRLLNEILVAIMKNFELSTDLRTDQLIATYRSAIKLNDPRIEATIWQILCARDCNEKIKTNVHSYFVLNGEWRSIATGYETGGCELDSHQKVSALMREIQFVPKTNACQELNDEIAKEKHLKSHSE